MNCRVCDKKNLSLAIDLKEQPWGNHFLSLQEVGKEPFYPLRVVYCHNCCTSQLDYTVKKEVMFSTHTYLSGMTTSLNHHFESVACALNAQFFQNNPQKCVLDIGSNDGTQLRAYQKLGFDVLGVESCETIAQIAQKNNIPTLHAFFNLDCAEKIGKRFDVINASGVFFHLEELHSVTEAIRLSLKEEGIFVLQFLYMKSIMENGAFDQIYHEHLLYYTLETVDHLLQLHGLSLFDATLSPIHGGSIIGYVCHKNRYQKTKRLETLLQEETKSGCNTLAAYVAFAENILVLKKHNLAFLKQKKMEGKTVFGMGAPVKGNTLLNTFDIGKNYLDCLVEKNPLRKGLFSPGKHLPIVMEDELVKPPDVYYVLAWNFKAEILKRNQHLIRQGVEFYFPINPSAI